MEETKKRERASTATVRKASSHGTVTQKMFTFRIDLENLEHLEKQTNKGRYINELIEKDRSK